MVLKDIKFKDDILFFLLISVPNTKNRAKNNVGRSFEITKHPEHPEVEAVLNRKTDISELLTNSSGPSNIKKASTITITLYFPIPNQISITLN